jgi:hypothetical protein
MHPASEGISLHNDMETYSREYMLLNTPLQELLPRKLLYFLNHFKTMALCQKFVPSYMTLPIPREKIYSQSGNKGQTQSLFHRHFGKHPLS